MCIFWTLRIKIQSSDLIWGTKFRAPCSPWFPYHFSSSFSSIFLFSSYGYVVRFIHFWGWCNWTYPYAYILIINPCLLFIIKCFLLCINVCFGLITLYLMLWFKLSLGNAFELIYGEKHLKGFVSKDRKGLFVIF